MLIIVYYFTGVVAYYVISRKPKKLVSYTVQYVTSFMSDLTFLKLLKKRKNWYKFDNFAIVIMVHFCLYLKKMYG